MNRPRLVSIRYVCRAYYAGAVDQHRNIWAADDLTLSSVITVRVFGAYAMVVQVLRSSNRLNTGRLAGRERPSTLITSAFCPFLLAQIPAAGDVCPVLCPLYPPTNEHEPSPLKVQQVRNFAVTFRSALVARSRICRNSDPPREQRRRCPTKEKLPQCTRLTSLVPTCVLQCLGYVAPEFHDRN